jgi:hypothetical protein
MNRVVRKQLDLEMYKLDLSLIHLLNKPNLKRNLGSLFMNSNNFIERKEQSPRTRKVYKRTEYPKGYYNLKNKSNLPDSPSQN